MPDRRLRALARDTKNNRVVRLYRKQGSGYTRNKSSAKLAKVKPGMFSPAEARKAVAWGQRHGIAVYTTRSKWPFVVCDVAPPGDQVMRILDGVGQRLGRYVKIISGDRTPYQAWQLRMRYLNGTGNLAALCCSNAGRHSWAACGKTPHSNHARGRAADCGVVHSGRSTGYTSLGAWPGAKAALRAEGGCLPVPGELWHVEHGTVWRA